jgi:hypothetical protein
MVAMELPESRAHEPVLAPDKPETRADSLQGWISLGEPVAIRITPENVDEDKQLRAFVEAEAATYIYHMVGLTCTFRPRDGEPFVNARLMVQLARTGHDQPSQPIAWSMDPLRLTRPVEYKRKVEVGAKLELLHATIGPTMSSEQSFAADDTFIDGLNLRQSTPIWEFRRTKSVEIRGSHLLAMVVRSPRDSVTHGDVTLSANVSRRQLGVISYQAAFPDSPGLTFSLT